MPTEWIPLDTPRLRIRLESEAIDAYSFGLIHTHLQRIADRVAFRLLTEEGRIDPTWLQRQMSPDTASSEYRGLVRLEVVEVRRGSIVEIISIAVSAALNDPWTVAILQNLAADMIFAIAMWGAVKATKHVRLVWQEAKGKRSEPLIVKSLPARSKLDLDSRSSTPAEERGPRFRKRGLLEESAALKTPDEEGACFSKKLVMAMMLAGGSVEIDTAGVDIGLHCGPGMK